MAKSFVFDDDSYFDNDASSSVFGYLFQAKAATWLFLNNFEITKSMKVETEKQDIELLFKDNTRLYAQAKAQQSYSTSPNSNSKLASALSSLSRTKKNKNDKILYISNLQDPLKSVNDIQTRFQEIAYKSLSPKQKETVDTCLKSIIKKIDKDIYDNPSFSEDKRKLLDCVKNIDLDSLYFCSIYRCSEMGEADIIDNIKLKLSSLFPRDEFNVLKVFNNWYDLALVSESSVQDNSSKKITINDFSLCLANSSLKLEQFDYNGLVDKHIIPEISSASRERVEDLIENKIFDFKNDNWLVFNSIINLYDEFKKDRPKSFDRDFIEENWSQFKDKLTSVDEKEDIRQVLTRYYLYRFLNKESTIKRIKNKAGIDNENF